MAWTVVFDEQKNTIGTLASFFGGEFVYKNSVNITDSGSVSDFIATSKKIQANPPNAGDDAKIAEILATITEGLNK